MRKDLRFLSTHGRALAAVTARPDSRIRDVAEALGVTERAAQTVINDLVEAGYLGRIREGRRNRYVVRGNRALQGLPAGPGSVTELVGALGHRAPAGPCDTVVLACSDHRFHPDLLAFLEELRLIGRAELILWPGGGPALAGGDRTNLYDALSRVRDRVGAARLVLVAHDSCDAPNVPKVAGSGTTAAVRAVRKWIRRIVAETVDRLEIQPELWLVVRGRFALISGPAPALAAGAGRRASRSNAAGLG